MNCPRLRCLFCLWMTTTITWAVKTKTFLPLLYQKQMLQLFQKPQPRPQRPQLFWKDKWGEKQWMDLSSVPARVLLFPAATIESSSLLTQYWRPAAVLLSAKKQLLGLRSNRPRETSLYPLYYPHGYEHWGKNMKAEGKKKTSWSRVYKAIYNFASETSIFLSKRICAFLSAHYYVTIILKWGSSLRSQKWDLVVYFRDFWAENNSSSIVLFFFFQGPKIKERIPLLYSSSVSAHKKRLHRESAPGRGRSMMALAPSKQPSSLSDINYIYPNYSRRPALNHSSVLWANSRADFAD